MKNEGKTIPLTLFDLLFLPKLGNVKKISLLEDFSLELEHWGLDTVQGIINHLGGISRTKPLFYSLSSLFSDTCRKIKHFSTTIAVIWTSSIDR